MAGRCLSAPAIGANGCCRTGAPVADPAHRLILAGASSLYPVVIKAAFDAFDTQNKRVVQLIPFVVILVTAVKGFAMLAPVRR